MDSQLTTASRKRIKFLGSGNSIACRIDLTVKTVFSAALWQLGLKEQAVPESLDLSRCGAMLADMETCDDVREAMGPIIVNSSMWTAPEASGLVRAHKDAHVMAMCLAVYWHRCESDDVQQALHKACSDLVLEARKLGHGAAFSGQKLKLVEAEEEQRKVMGLSAYRVRAGAERGLVHGSQVKCRQNHDVASTVRSQGQDLEC